MLEWLIVMNALNFLLSPMGPPLVLSVGAAILLLVGQWVRQPGWLTGLALFFAMAASALWLQLRFQSIVPNYSFLWQPLLQSGANLVWVGDGWNWYISGLLLLLGGVGLLLNSDGGSQQQYRQTSIGLGMHLAVMAAAVLFVNSANLLTTMFTWVALDLIVMLRNILLINRQAVDTQRTFARSTSLFGALFLSVALLPVGASGPNQPMQGGILPQESIVLLLAACVLRIGIYPFHAWLLPSPTAKVNLAERLIDHMAPAVCGLWLLGWVLGLGGQELMSSTEVLVFLSLSILGSALVAFSSKDQVNHTTFVLIGLAGAAVLAGALAFNNGPAAMIWPTTAFALGGALWLVGEQVWQGWGWQVPVSVGALALAGVPFTPGFLAQPSFARLLISGWPYISIFALFALAQGLLLASLLRSWGGAQRISTTNLAPATILRLLISIVALGAPLAMAGFLPSVVAMIAGVAGAIPPLLGYLPIVMAEPPVWFAVAAPLVIGVGFVSLLPRLRGFVGAWLTQIGRVARLDWLFDANWWSINQIGERWGETVNIIEGGGYLGWLLVFIVLALLIIQS